MSPRLPTALDDTPSFARAKVEMDAAAPAPTTATRASIVAGSFEEQHRWLGDTARGDSWTRSPAAGASGTKLATMPVEQARSGEAIAHCSAPSSGAAEAEQLAYGTPNARRVPGKRHADAHTSTGAASCAQSASHPPSAAEMRACREPRTRRHCFARHQARRSHREHRQRDTPARP